jgi:KipI family sensor histidine kinase inhibitor
VLYDPREEGFAAFAERLLGLPGDLQEERPRVHEIPTLYGGEGGMDLAEVARATGLTEEGVIRLHSGGTYTALMLGFTPGFAYLGGLDPRLGVPRRANPRTRVEAGSVALARGFTGVYPAASAGGWNLIGRTRFRLFDPLRESPSLIRPGDQVRFVPVQELPEPETPRPRLAARGGAIEVVEGGLLTTVQDLGRPGFRRLGVGGAGPVDAASHRAANRTLGNAEDAAALEITLQGPLLRFQRAVRFALAGADLGASLLRADLGEWRCPVGVPIQARPGNLLSFRGGGVRACLAVAGGIDVPLVLGSASTDLPGGFGGYEGRALRASDALGVKTPRPRGEEAAERRGSPDEATVRVVLGPQDDHFEPRALELFLGTPFRLSLACDRVGLRLEGPHLPHRGSAEIPSDGMVPGSVEVPPSGSPIVMLADAPTTGGYPKIATVVSPDLHRLSQLPPGTGTVRFEAVTVEEAQEILRASLG